MARLFKQCYTAKNPDGSRITKKSKRWYIELRIANGSRKRVPAFADRKASLQLAARLEREAELEQAGVLDPYREHRSRPLAEHAEDWRKSLLDKDSTLTYAELSINRVKAVLDATKTTHWRELDANRVTGYLAERRANGLSVESSNHYLRRIKQFARWMVRSRRAPDNPLESLTTLNSNTDRRHDRRALTPDEVTTLIATTAKSETLRGMPGNERAMLYRVALETGFRAGEIRNLKPAAFDLIDEEGRIKLDASVVVDAAYSKRRTQDVQPIRPEFAALLVEFLKPRSRTELVFAMPKGYHLSKIIKADLDTAEIPYKDESGRYADFHSLRHTFITNLARGGVHPKVAQQLARHSTIGLTMDRYSHSALSDLRDALLVLPRLSEVPDQVRHRATGTTGKLLPNRLPNFLPTPATSPGPRPASGCIVASIHGDEANAPEPVGIGKTGYSSRRSASVRATGVDRNRTCQEPRERPFNGFEGRGTHQESGHSQHLQTSKSRNVQKSKRSRVQTLKGQIFST